MVFPTKNKWECPGLLDTKSSIIWCAFDIFRADRLRTMQIHCCDFQ